MILEHNIVTRNDTSRRPLRILSTFALFAVLLSAGCSDYTQKEKDRDTLIAFRGYFAAMWNENVVGTSSSTIDYTLSNAFESADAGTASGSLHVTGQGQSDGKTYTLLFAFDGYRFSSGSTQSIRIESITGDISVNGVAGEEMVFTADELAVDGTVANSNEDARGALDSLLSMDCTATSTSGSGSVNDRDPVSWNAGSSSSSSSSTCSQYTIACGTVTGGIEVTGGVVPQTCSCPTGTTQDGVDNVTSGGPYFICTCNGS